MAAQGEGEGEGDGDQSMNLHASVSTATSKCASAWEPLWLRASAKVRETGKRTKLSGAALPAHRRDPVWLAVSARSIHGRGNRILQCFDMTLLCRLRNTELNGSI